MSATSRRIRLARRRPPWKHVLRVPAATTKEHAEELRRSFAAAMRRPGPIVLAGDVELTEVRHR